MDKVFPETAQLLIDSLISDIADTVNSNPSRKACIWWRGRLAGVVDTLTALTDDIDTRNVDEALDALGEAEDLADH